MKLHCKKCGKEFTADEPLDVKEHYPPRGLPVHLRNLGSVKEHKHNHHLDDEGNWCGPLSYPYEAVE